MRSRRVSPLPSAGGLSRPKKKTLRTDRDYAGPVELAAKIIKTGGWMLCCANTHGLRFGEYQRQVEEGIRKGGRKVLDLQKKRMGADFSGDDYLKSLRVDVG